MGAKKNQPDWHSIAEKFDIWLPQIKPVGEALLEVLQAKAGDRILDLASGTGEPALTLAQRMGSDIDVIGVDAAEGMVGVAQKKVTTLGLRNIRFQTMAAEKLDFEDESFDRVLCRFGVMLFEDPLAGLKEMRRVLKPGGRYAFSIWGEAETMPVMYWSYEVFKDKVPEDVVPPLAKITSLGAPGAIDTLLAEAGFTDISVERRTFHYQFKTFEAYWDAVEASDILKQQFDALPASEKDSVRNEIAEFASKYIGENGLMVPHDFLLAYGSK